MRGNPAETQKHAKSKQPTCMCHDLNRYSISLVNLFYSWHGMGKACLQLWITFNRHFTAILIICFMMKKKRQNMIWTWTLIYAHTAYAQTMLCTKCCGQSLVFSVCNELCSLWLIYTFLIWLSTNCWYQCVNFDLSVYYVSVWGTTFVTLLIYIYILYINEWI